MLKMWFLFRKPFPGSKEITTVPISDAEGRGCFDTSAAGSRPSFPTTAGRSVTKIISLKVMCGHTSPQTSIPILHIGPKPRTDKSSRPVSEEVLLGRGRDCTCLCLSMYVSRHHVKIRPRGDGGLCLIDLGSSNGTFINSRKVTPNTEETLCVGDEVGIGNIVSDNIDCYVFIVKRGQIPAIPDEQQEGQLPANPSEKQQEGQLPAIPSEQQEVPPNRSVLALKRFVVDCKSESPEPEVYVLSDDEDVKESKEPPASPHKKLKIEADVCAVKDEDATLEKKVELSGSSLSEKQLKNDSVTNDRDKPFGSGVIAQGSEPDIEVLISNVEPRKRPTNLRLSLLRNSSKTSTWTSSLNSTPSKSTDVKPLVTSTPFVNGVGRSSGPDCPELSSTEWSPIARRLSDVEQTEKAVEAENSDQREEAKRTMSVESRLEVDKQRVGRRLEPENFDHLRLEESEETLCKRNRADQLQKDQELARRLASEESDEFKSHQLLEDAALAKRLEAEECKLMKKGWLRSRSVSAEQPEAQTNRSKEEDEIEKSQTSRSSSANYTLDEEIHIVSSGDEEDDIFPASQMFAEDEQKPSRSELDQIMTEKAAGEGQGSSTEKGNALSEQDLDDAIVLSSDDEDDVQEANRWYERLSQSQSIRIKEEVDERESAEQEQEEILSVEDDWWVGDARELEKCRKESPELVEIKEAVYEEISGDVQKKDSENVSYNEKHADLKSRLIVKAAAEHSKESSDARESKLKLDEEFNRLLGDTGTRSISESGSDSHRGAKKSRRHESHDAEKKKHDKRRDHKSDPKVKDKRERDDRSERRKKSKDRLKSKSRDRHESSEMHDRLKVQSEDASGAIEMEEWRAKKRRQTEEKWKKAVEAFEVDSECESIPPGVLSDLRRAVSHEARVNLTRVEEDPSVPGRFRAQITGAETDGSDASEFTDHEVDAEALVVAPKKDVMPVPGSRRTALTDALPMPPRRAINRGISASEATRIYTELREQNRKPITASDRKGLRRQKLADMAAQQQRKNQERAEAKRGAPAKIKVTKANRGSFLVAEKVLSPSSKPRSRQEVVRSMKPIPKLKEKPEGPNLPAKSPLQAMNMSWEKSKSKAVASNANRLTEAPFLEPLEIPTGPQPKRRIAQKPPPGFINSIASAPVPAPVSTAVAAPAAEALSELPTTSAADPKSAPYRSILCGSSKYNISVGKNIKKRVKFKEDIVQIQYIDRLPGTKPVKSSRDASLPASVNKPVVTPKLPTVYQDESCLEDVFYDISKWNPNWLNEEKNLPSDMVPPVVQNMNLPAIPRTEFLDFTEYHNTMYPLLMLELWSSVSKEYHSQGNDYRHRQMRMAVDRITPCPIPKRPEKVITTMFCHMLIDRNCGQNYPSLGNLVMVDLPIQEQPSCKVATVSVFGYISFDVKEPVDPCMKCHKELLKHCPKPAFRVRFNVFIRERKNAKILLDKIMRIKNVKYVRPDLRVFQAVKNLSNLQLQNSIISPSAAGEDFSLPDVGHRKLALNETLNPTQTQMVLQTTEVCLQSQPKICLVQGPPGTGKSHVISSLVLQLLYRDRMYSRMNREKGLVPRILLCAPSNNAVDVLVRRLLHRRQLLPQAHRFKMVRVGQPNCMHPDIKGISLQELANFDVKAQNTNSDISMDISNIKAKLAAIVNTIQENTVSGKAISPDLNSRKADLLRRQRVLEDRQKNAKLNGCDVQNKQSFAVQRESMKKILRGADIVATTLSSCLIKIMETVFQPVPDRYHFNVCIVDEATQCLEAETLIPLMLGVKTLVLVGDPMQLPATILSRVAKDKGLATSLFARLQKCVPNAVQQLNIQYRMHPDIIRWPNKFFYHKQLKTPDSLISLRESKVVPYAILSLSYLQEPNKELNEQEALLVIRLAELIVNNKAITGIPFRVGIVTPYQNQRRFLQESLNQRKSVYLSSIVEINTIDSFQGQEKDIIIMSCVRTSGVGFLADRQRLNVALTRAKYALFICGNFDSLDRDSMWNNLLVDANQRHCLLTIPPTVSSDDELWNYIAKK